MANPTPGTTIGTYQIEDTIGAGSMGDVFRGVDVGLKRKVAIKILSEKHRESPELRARFVREGRAVAAIQHPNVVQVFTTGTFDERPFIAMEFLDGTDLGTIVDEHGALSNLTAARMILDAARGLQAAARAGLIHRDVKPSNLVQLSDGRVKVTDFGLAKPVDPGAEPALTALGVVVGTPDYIAPEQARGDAIDERVDIYALGGTLYFLLVGTPPFRTGKPAEDKYLKVVARHLRQPPPDPRVARPEVDDELAELVRAMMAKKPAERPDYDSLIEQLGAVVLRLSAGGSGQLPRVKDTGKSDASGPISISRSAGGARSTQSTKTPFVGGDVPHGFQGAAAQVPEDGPAPGASLSTPTVTSTGLPGWLLAVTALCAVVLAIGVIYTLTRGSGDSAPAGSPHDAGRPAPDARDPHAQAVPPATVEPLPPTGMALVKRPDGTPWFFVDKAPVPHGDYARVFPQQKKPSPSLDAQPVTSVAYNFARAYAESVSKRLVAPTEYEAALAAAGVSAPPASTWEWVDAGDDSATSKPVRTPGKQATRPQTGAKDITFRLAKDLPDRDVVP